MASLTPDRPTPLSFALPVVAGAGALAGLFFGTANGSGLLGVVAGAVLAAGLAFVMVSLIRNERLAFWVALVAFVAICFAITGRIVPALILGLPLGAFFWWFSFWMERGRYRSRLLPYLTAEQVLWHYAFRVICGLIFFFLVAPLVPVMWLSFNAQDFFTFTPEMLAFEAEGYSLKHYRDFLGKEFLEGGGFPVTGLITGAVLGALLALVLAFFGKTSQIGAIVLILVFTVFGLIIGKLWGLNGAWITPLKNSFTIAPIATLISVSLGTLAAIGLSQSHVPGKRAIMAILISPMIVPLIISATGMFFFYSDIGHLIEAFGVSKKVSGYIKVILAHAVLGIPFVIITVTATLVGFDRSLTRAAANMGAGPVTTFFRIQMPLILPGVISGGLFAFITSFDEVVVVLFVGSASQKTLPWQMFTGLREQISPTILAVATILVLVSIALLTTVELLRRRSERLRGMSPG
ncbi:Polyamine ABC transporter, permease protein [Candidatus Rhodobacter oscarellae]|uniref:Polyamine ABC transporter, permease protein n=1 Tax=Candidatus Rhodobacter oscarellae TaxID=1675527 RepID=A0A0J9E5W2_9RHOB|nr:ABC transporter permease [Candidatus Rhodobacter lobularis]KMW57199.1 Polyamine ABC transporter, permease protein [Candidatus Rhodobacter lobularis]